MAKLSLPSFVGAPGATQLNTWKAALEAQAEDTVSLTGVLPNSMTVDLDMDSNDILNVGSLNANLLNTNDLNIGGLTVSGVLTEASASATAAAASEAAAQAAANSIVGYYDTLAELKAETNIVIGDIVQTYGYNVAGDGGGNLYEIVAAATGTDDGGSFIDLAGSGMQAKGLFVDRRVYPDQFGAVVDGTTDNSTQIMAANNFCNANGYIATLLSGKTYAVSNTVTLHAPQWDGRGAVIRQNDSSFLGRVVQVRVSNNFINNPFNLAISYNLTVDANRENNAAQELTSGTLVEGDFYFLKTYEAGDDFTNVECAYNESPNGFVASGTTPTVWTNLSTLRKPSVAVEFFSVNNPNANPMNIQVLNADVGVLLSSETERFTLNVGLNNDNADRSGVIVVSHGGPDTGTPDEMVINANGADVGGVLWVTGPFKTSGQLNANVEQFGTGFDGVAFLANNAWWVVKGQMRGIRKQGLLAYANLSNRLDFDLWLISAASAGDIEYVGELRQGSMTGKIRTTAAWRGGGLWVWAAQDYSLSFTSDGTISNYGCKFGNSVAGNTFGRKVIPLIDVLAAVGDPGVLLDKVERCRFGLIRTTRLEINTDASFNNYVPLVTTGATPHYVPSNVGNALRNTVVFTEEANNSLATLNGGNFYYGMRVDRLRVAQSQGADYAQVGTTTARSGWVRTDGTVLAAGSSYAPASGVATFSTSGATQFYSHGLGFAPDKQMIEIYPIDATGGTSMISVTGTDATVFAVTADVVPSASFDFYWRVKAI